ncbi:MAG: hypothetical protein ACXW0H_04960 [Methylobacter sp.]
MALPVCDMLRENQPGIKIIAKLEGDEMQKKKLLIQLGYLALIAI